jgi:cobalt-zinc-cadmium efflux system outer membrane protein
MARWKPLVPWTLAVLTLAPLLAAGDRRLTLDEAVADALSRHPAILQAEKEVESARGRRLQLEAVPNPELNFATAGLPLWNASGEKEFSLGLRQLFEFPGKRRLRGEIGRSYEDQASLELDRARNIVRGRVQRAYFHAAYVQSRLAGLRSILSTLKDYSDLAAKRYESGQVPYLDIIRGRVETLRVQNEIVEARREFKEKAAALLLLMGESSFEPVELSTEIDFVPLERSWDELKAEALAGTILRLSQARRQQAALAVSLAGKAGLPDFSVGLFVPSKRLGGWGFELGMSLPVFRGGFRGAEMEAAALSEEASIESERQARRVLIVAERAYADARALEEQIELFRGSLIREVEESLKACLTSYQYGKSGALDVLDIVRSLKETRTEFLRALLNHRLAVIELEEAGEDEAVVIASGE